MDANHCSPFISFNRPQRRGQNDLVFTTGERRGGFSIPVSGLCSPAVFEAEHKIGIDLLDLQTGARKSLAVRSPQPINGLMWNFDDATLQWGNEVLKQISVPQNFYPG